MDKRKNRKVLSRRLKNNFIECENHYIMKIKEHDVLISKENYELVQEYKWCINAYGYVTSHRAWKELGTLFLHQLIHGKKEGFIIDHINRNPLDNKKDNLRYATKQTNSMNSKVKGVSYRKDTNKWSAMIVVGGKRIMLGCYENYNEAKSVRKQAEEKYFKPIIEIVANHG